MELLIETPIDCPYCGQGITLVIDSSQADQQIIEDCSVCCRPINLRISCSPGELLAIEARREEEA
jgi:hypothetical protein